MDINMSGDRFIPEKVRRFSEYKIDKNEYRIRLDANECPYRPELCADPSGISLNRYPDPGAEGLRAAFAEAYGVKSADVVVGNGSDELISIIFGAFLPRGAKVAICAPDFSMYELYAETYECELIKYCKREGYLIDFGELEALIRDNGVELCILSNPCNPTGYAYDREQISKFVKGSGCVTVIDEAYSDFSDRDISMLGEYEQHDNLIVLKTMSKYGFAALRIGFAISKTISGSLMKLKSPYNVNQVSQYMAQLALRDFDAVKRNIELIKRDTSYLQRSLEQLAERGGYKVVPTDANFVSVVFDEPAKAVEVDKALRAEGISVRVQSQGRLRITCGTPEENSEFLRVLEGALK